MSSVFDLRAAVPAALVAVAIGAHLGAAPAPLRVCADPNNMPFSNQRLEGFENKIAALVAGELHRPVAYFWFPQRRGFIRNSLQAGRCDVVMSVPAGYELVQPTVRYYRSSYAFVSRQSRHLDIVSFDDPRLRRLTIGIQLTGDDYDNPPAAQALAIRHLAEQVRGFPVYGDYSTSDPQRDIVDAVADGRVDVAVVWGPLAGYYARRAARRLRVTPIAADRAGPHLPLAYDIAMGVRRGDGALKTTLDAVIRRRGADMRRILRSYGVPLV